MDERTLLVFGPKLFRLAVAVVSYDRVGHGEDALGRAPVLFELDDPGLGVIFLEVEDIRDIGAAPAVDRLVRVAGHAQVPVLACQQVGDEVLGVVGVLVFVDEDEAVAVLQAFEQLLVLLQHACGSHEEVVEVEGVGRGQARLVRRIHAVNGLSVEPVRRVGVLVGRLEHPLGA